MPLSVLASAIHYLEQARQRKPAGSRKRTVEQIREDLSECVRLLQCTKGSVWLTDTRRGGLYCFLALDDAHKKLKLKSFRLKAGEGITGICAQTGRPFVVNDVGGDVHHSRKVDELIGSRTTQILACPLKSRGCTLGTLNVLNRRPDSRQSFDEADILVGQIFAGWFADQLALEDIWGIEGDIALAESAMCLDTIARKSEPAEPVCISAQMRDIMAKIRSARERNLLLTGETGVGKDLLARWAHNKSRLSKGPFVEIDCAAIQETLFESEIFGHAKGAFTGAVREKPGRVEEAAGGTLFLDEIGELPLPMQAKLLSFLDTGEFMRVGENRPRRVKTRIIAATNRVLRDEMRAARFRRDLFFRLADIEIHIPPLRDRPMDITGIAQMHLHELATAAGVQTPWVPETTREMLLRCPWEGNTRQLLAAIETAFTNCLDLEENTLRPEHFPMEVVRPTLGSAYQGAESIIRQGTIKELLEKLTEVIDAPVNYVSRPANGQAPPPAISGGSLFGNPAQLKQLLDRTRCVSSGRWNICAVYRELRVAGFASMSRRAFARRIRQMFPDEKNVDTDGN